MRNNLLTFTAFVAVSSTVVFAQPVAARKPDSQSPARLAKSRGAIFAQRDVERLKQLSAKNPKLADRLKTAQQRLELLRKTNPKGDPKALHVLETIKLSRPVISCRFEPAGRFLFAGAQDSALHRIDLLTGARTDLLGHESWIRRFDLAGTGNRLVTGSYAGRIIWWNPVEETPKPLRSVEAHKGFVRGVALSPDGELLATGGNDNMVRLWSAVDGRLIRELPGHKRHVYNVRFDPSGKYLVSGDLLGVLKQWDVATGKLARELDAKILSKYDKTFLADCGGIRGMAFSPDGKFLVVCGISNVTNAFAGVGNPTAVLFDFATGKRLKVLKPAKSYRGTCWGVAWHPSGEYLVGAGGGGGGMLWFWKPNSEKTFHEVKLPACGYDVCFHPDGLRLAVALYNQSLVVYDLGPKAAAKGPMKRTRRK